MRRILSLFRPATRSATQEVGETGEAEPQYRARDLCASEVAALEGCPSIIVATLPYADTKCVCQTLAQTLGYEQGRSLFKGSFIDNSVVLHMAADFARGGLVGGWHLRGTPSNVEALLRAGLSKVVVHVRDPRASALVHGRLRYCRDRPKLLEDERYVYEFVAPAGDPEFDERLDGFVKRACGWITEWLGAIDNTPGLRVLIQSHEELTSDAETYFRSVLDFYGLEKPQLVIAPKDQKWLFANGGTDAWRDALAPSQIERMSALIPARLVERFGWAR